MKIGERVSGRYKIIKQIGSGGMANVYLAEDLILERKVAVKMMSLHFDNNERDNLRRFQREALSTTELTHPNIVNVYDVGEGDRPYIVMEYVEGTDLKGFIQENHPIPYKKVIDVMVQILSGISYAHANGVIHRDIKPHNILIDKDGVVKITDFGIAVALSQNSITQTNSILGSVQYISPEQARGNMVTKQSDIYSLGIVLYEMLTGAVPFDGESAVSVALKHFQSPIPSLRDFDSRMPQPLENVVLKATAKEPIDRYKTVDEMKEDLETSLDTNRRSEPIFVPIDLNKEDTLIMSEPFEDVEKVVSSSESTNTAEESEVEKQELPKVKKKRPWWLLLIPLILIIGFFAWVLSRPQEVVIPEEIIGLEFDDAVELLEENGLLLGETIDLPNDEVEEGIVFRTSPIPGGTVLEGAEIDLYVSLGEEPYEIEDYTGQKYEEVRANLTELGFTVESETSSSDTVEEGNIIEQSIDPGEDVLTSETTISFIVSSGRQEIKVSDLTGFSRPGVQGYVNQEGLQLEITEASSEEIPADILISQDPEPGSTLYAGDTLKVVFSTGPEEVELIEFTKTIIIPYQAKYAETETTNGEQAEEETNQEEPVLLPNDIQIYINDYEKNFDAPTHQLRIIDDHEYPLNFVVEQGSSATYYVVRDGSKIIEETVNP